MCLFCQTEDRAAAMEGHTDSLVSLEEGSKYHTREAESGAEKEGKEEEEDEDSSDSSSEDEESSLSPFEKAKIHIQVIILCRNF